MDIVTIICCILLFTLAGITIYFLTQTGSEAPTTTEAPTSTPVAPTTTEAPTTTPVSPTTTEAPTSTPVAANVGDFIYCTAYNPKGQGAIYKYNGDNSMSYYPSNEIAASWDSQWASKIKTIDCTGYTLTTTDIELKQ